MITDLLYISKDLLNTISIHDFTYEEKECIINVVKKTIGLAILELENKEDLCIKVNTLD